MSSLLSRCEIASMTAQHIGYSTHIDVAWYMLWLGVCLSVRHKPVFYQNARMDSYDFQHTHTEAILSFPSLHFREIRLAHE